MKTKKATTKDRKPRTHKELAFHLYNELRGANVDYTKVADYISDKGYNARTKRGINQAWVYVDITTPQDVIKAAIKKAIV